MIKKSLFSLFFLFGLVTGIAAQHTFSIAAVDPITGEVGAAGATCLTSADCGGCGGAVIINNLIPGRGAANAQAQVCIPNTNLNSIITLLNQGNSPQQALDNMLTFDNCIFGDTSDRQYGIADLDSMNNPRAVGFTGSGTLSYANHIVGPNYAIQGNILLGQFILDSMEAGFLNTPGPLCDKLMAALQGANVPGADSRCLSDSISSKSSFIRVARPGDTQGAFWLNLIVGATNPFHDPIDSLQTLFDDFKLANNLAEPAPAPSLLLYPNPTHPDHPFITVEYAQLSPLSPSLEVYDLLGRRLDRLEQLPLDGKYELDLRPYGVNTALFVVYSDPEAEVYRTQKILLR
ncbi:MAG: DUF1028 domain-containing protein [Bacteroidota bacterium]